VRYRSVLLSIFLLSNLSGFIGCYLNPKKGYPGPEQPRQELALITQTDYLESRPIFILEPTGGAENEIRVDDLGVTLLPGAYTFKAKLYGYHDRRSVRLVDVPVDSGHSSFTLPRTVLERVRDKEPYKTTDDTVFTVKAGFRYGIWCNQGGQIKIRVLDPYK
jgi:hypothetical protein